MPNDSLCLIPLENAAQLLASKQIGPVELTRAMLERIERLNPRLNAYMTVTADAALAAAAAAEREIAAGRYRGGLHGVPVAVKDLFATRGVRTTAGSKVLADWLPDFDATVVTKLREAGAVLLGKLGLHEFAYGTTSDNVHYGPIRNPWDTERVPGGSSGGSGAATAAGLAFATLGSDTGGSIRIPASECGVVGLMPTYGRVSLHGAIPLSWSMDHAGPLTRTVRDAAVVLQVIAGHDPLDPATKRRPVPDFLGGVEEGAKGLRVGVPEHHFRERLDPEVDGLVRQAIATLGSAGAEIRDVPFPLAGRYASNVGAIIGVEAAAYHAPNYPSRKDEYGPLVSATLEVGAKVPATVYASALQVLLQARAGEADAVLDCVDVLAVPTMPEPPPTIASTRSEERVVRRTIFTGLLDLTGQPVITVPCGLTAAGLPVGVSFVARRWDEATLLRAARAYEQARGPFPHPPDP